MKPRPSPARASVGHRRRRDDAPRHVARPSRQAAAPRPAQRPGGAAFALAAAVLIATTSTDAATWRDPVFGFTVELPHGSRPIARPGQGVLLRVDLERGGVIRLELDQPAPGTSRQQLLDVARADVLSATTAVEVDRGEPPAWAVERPASLAYFAVDRRDRGDRFIGVAVFPFDEGRFVLGRIDGDAADFERLTDRFETLLASFTHADPVELHRARQDLLRLGHRRALAVDREARFRVSEPELWYRMSRGEDDAGYMRVRIEAATEFDRRGFRVTVHQTLRADAARQDRESTYFASFDGAVELWSINATHRLTETDPRLRGATRVGWVETGLRSPAVTPRGNTINRIDVTRQWPSGKTESRTWPTPGAAYLGLADRWLVEPAWAAAAAADEAWREPLAIYAYDPDGFDLTYRTVEPRPVAGGGVELLIRPNPRHALQTHAYDDIGRRVRWERGPFTLRRTTLAELKRRWAAGLPER